MRVTEQTLPDYYELLQVSPRADQETIERVFRHLARRYHPDTRDSGNAAKFAQAFTEKLMMYAVNRELEYFDMPQVRAVVRGAAKDQYTLSSIVQGIVRSDAFLKQGTH